MLNCGCFFFKRFIFSSTCSTNWLFIMCIASVIKFGVERRYYIMHFCGVLEFDRLFGVTTLSINMLIIFRLDGLH
jgi:hypothetical protein